MCLEEVSAGPLAVLVPELDRVADPGGNVVAEADIQRQARPGQPRAELAAAQEGCQPGGTGQQGDGLAHRCFNAYRWHEYQRTVPNRGRTLIDLDPGSAQVDSARPRVQRPRAAARPSAHRPARPGGERGRADRSGDSREGRLGVQAAAGRVARWHYGYRVARPEWEKILTALRRGECNALMVPDIDRATRDPRTLEDLIDAVELYGLYVTLRACLTSRLIGCVRAFTCRREREELRRDDR